MFSPWLQRSFENKREGSNKEFMKDMEHRKRLNETTGRRKSVLMRDYREVKINDISFDFHCVVEHCGAL